MNKLDLVQQTVHEIESWITTGKYKEGVLFPSEGEISKILEVSRGTVRDAIRTLEVKGYVERLHGIGIRVKNTTTEVAIASLRDMIKKNNITFSEILEIRNLIEPEASSMAAKNASEDDIKQLKKCVDIMETNQLSSPEFIEADCLFHRTIAKASGNRLLNAIILSYNELLAKQIITANKSNKIETDLLHYHKNIYDNIKTRDSKAAQQSMLTHLTETERNLHKIGAIQ